MGMELFTAHQRFRRGDGFEDGDEGVRGDWVAKAPTEDEGADGGLDKAGAGEGMDGLRD